VSRRRLLVALVAGTFAGALGACTLLTDLDGFTCSGAACDDAEASVADAPGVDDAAKDSALPDATTDASDASDASDAKVDVDSGPPPLLYACGAQKVTDCATCSGSPLPCILCASNGSDHSTFVGVCVSTVTSSACQGKGPSGYDDCLCTSSPAPCVEPYQICVQPNGPACRTCGFDGGNGLPCKGGGTCNGTTCL
jgi:hypothetical protein